MWGFGECQAGEDRGREGGRVFCAIRAAYCLLLLLAVTAGKWDNVYTPVGAHAGGGGGGGDCIILSKA